MISFILRVLVVFISSFFTILLLKDINHFDFICYIISWTVSAIVMGVWGLLDE